MNDDGHPARRLLTSLLAVLTLSSCDIVRSLPLIQPIPLRATAAPIVFEATITQNGQPINPSFTVSCEVSLRLTPPGPDSVLPLSIQGTRGSGSTWKCPLTPQHNAVVRPNQVVGVRWQVFGAPQQPGDPPLKVAESPDEEAPLGCSDRDRALREEQRTVLDKYDRLHTDIDLASRGFFPTHGHRSYKGMGVAFIKAGDAAQAALGMPSGPPTLGDPNLLLFQKQGDRYDLIGWAYAQTIGSSFPMPIPPDGGPGGSTDQPRPVLPCIPHHEWLIHAAGYHNLDGTFTVAQAGQAFNPAPWHPAIWDLHVFADRATGIPKLRILNDDPPSASPDGLDAPGAWFYPKNYDQKRL